MLEMFRAEMFGAKRDLKMTQRGDASTVCFVYIHVSSLITEKERGRVG